MTDYINEEMIGGDNKSTIIMSGKVLVVLVAFVAISSGLPSTFNNTSVRFKTDFSKIHRAANLGNTPYLPLVRFKDVVYYYGAILQGNRDQVELFCSYHNMKLVSIQTHEETENLIAGLGAFLQSSEVVSFWTSGRRYGNDWRWESTGRPAHYTNWANGEPNNSGGKENCIEAGYNGNTKTLQWNDNDCNAARFFLCESRDN